MQNVATSLDQVVNLHKARGSSQVQDEQKKPDPLKNQTNLKTCENKPAFEFSFLEVVSSKLQRGSKKKLC